MSNTIKQLEDKLRRQQVRLLEETHRRKAAERALKIARETVKAALKKMPVLIYALDDDGEIIFYNEEFRRVTGYTEEDILEDPEAVNMLVPEHLDHDPDRDKEKEWRIRCKDGSEKVVAWSNISMHFPISGWKGWKVGVDITFRKKLEEDRLLKEKLQGVLELSGAVCHELNQPLQVVSGYTELIELEIPRDHEFYDSFARLREQVYKMAKITRKLMKITRYRTKDYLDGKIIDIDEAST